MRLSTLLFANGTAAEKKSFLENKPEFIFFYKIAVARFSVYFACAPGAADETRVVTIHRLLLIYNLSHNGQFRRCLSVCVVGVCLCIVFCWVLR